MKLLLTALLLTATAAQAADPAEPMQAADSYEAAIKNQSTSPSYVRVSVNTDGAWRTRCTTANFLKGAIMVENNLGHDAAGAAETERIALANTTQHFRFTRPDAIARLSGRVSDEDLRFMRRRFDPFSNDDLKAGLAMGGSLRPLVDNLPRSLRDAAACALIERGLSPRQADLSGQLWVDRG